MRVKRKLQLSREPLHGGFSEEVFGREAGRGIFPCQRPGRPWWSARAQIVGDREAEGLAAEFFRGGDIEGLGGGVGVDAFRIGRGFPHAVATLSLGGGRHVAVKARDAREDDLIAVGLVDHVADAAVDGDDDGVAD